jgi:sulfur carrier protein
LILLNGENCELQPGDNLSRALECVGLTSQSRGVAVAVNGEVVPRSVWDTYTLGADARVEVLSAMQGG